MNASLKFSTLGAGLKSVQEQFPNRAIIHFKRGKKFESETYSDFYRETKRWAKALIARGYEHQSRIGILSENRKEWLLADSAILSIGSVSTPIFFGENPQDLEYKLNDTRCGLLFVSNQKQADKLISIENRLHYLKEVVHFDPLQIALDLRVTPLQGFLNEGAEVGEVKLVSRGEAVSTDDLAMFIYTSGSTGDPRGAMLTHGNILHNQEGVRKMIAVDEEDVFLSFLPWHHSFGGQYERFLALLNGASLAIAESLDIEKIIGNFGEISPSIFFSVPLNFERIKARTEGEDAESQSARKKVFHTGAKLFMTGGVSLDGEIIKYFKNQNVKVGETYGLTEVGPVLTINLGGPVGSVGRPIPGVEMRIVDPETREPVPRGKVGEVAVKGKNIMKGYLNRPEATKAAIVNEWFFTGDRGEQDEAGNLTIRGRYKNLIIPITGENISPEKIENALKGIDALIAQAVAVGDGQKYIGALIQPNFPLLKKLAESKNINEPSGEALTKHPEIKKHFGKIVEGLNGGKTLRKMEKIGRIVLISKPFSQASGELTSSLKVKRHVVIDRWANIIHQMYLETPGEHVIIVKR